MSTVYNPNGTLPAATQPAPVAVATASNATPIAITTSSPHGFTDGDTVEIVGNSAGGANGLWVIHVTGASSFTLNGSTASGAGTGGIATDYSINPLLTIPADGDLVNASSVNVPLEGTANAIPYLYARTGAYRVVDRQVVHVSDDTWATWASRTTTGTGAWEEIAATASLFTGYALPGDVLQVEAALTGTATTGGSYGAVGVMVYGTTLVTGSAQVIGTSGTPNSVTLVASYGVAGSPGGSAYQVSLACYSFAPGDAYALQGHRSIVLTHYRSNA